MQPGPGPETEYQQSSELDAEAKGFMAELHKQFPKKSDEIMAVTAESFTKKYNIEETAIEWLRTTHNVSAEQANEVLALISDIVESLENQGSWNVPSHFAAGSIGAGLMNLLLAAFGKSIQAPADETGFSVYGDPQNGWKMALTNALVALSGGLGFALMVYKHTGDGNKQKDKYVADLKQGLNDHKFGKEVDVEQASAQVLDVPDAKSDSFDLLVDIAKPLQQGVHSKNVKSAIILGGTLFFLFGILVVRLCQEIDNKGLNKILSAFLEFLLVYILVRTTLFPAANVLAAYSGASKTLIEQVSITFGVLANEVTKIKSPTTNALGSSLFEAGLLVVGAAVAAAAIPLTRAKAPLENYISSSVSALIARACGGQTTATEASKPLLSHDGANAKGRSSSVGGTHSGSGDADVETVNSGLGSVQQLGGAPAKSRPQTP